MNKEEILSKMVERDRYPYPRSLLRLYPEPCRSVCQNRDEFLKFNLLNKDIYANIFSEYQLAEREYDMLYLDIDDSDLDVAYTKLVLLLSRLKAVGIEHYFIIFSGSKGFHVYVPFESVRLVEYRKSAVAFLQSINVLELIDIQVINTVRGMRLPYSVNTKSGFTVISLGNRLVFSKEEILARSLACEHADFEIIPNVGLGKILLNWDGIVVKQNLAEKHSTIVKGSKSILFSDEQYFPPCMLRLYNLAKEGTPLNHVERMELGIFLLHIYGGDVEKVSRYYRAMGDWNPDITNYHLEYFIRTNQHLMGCDNLDKNGICCMDQDICPYSPSINRFLRIDKSKILKSKISVEIET